VIELASVDSPIGRLTLAARGRRLCMLHFGAPDDAVDKALRRWYPDEAVSMSADPAGVATALATYFSGELSSLDGIDVELNGTPFQVRVWNALRSVRAGTTASYAELADRIGARNAVRAVGAANGANPVAIVLPCHRIIGSNGSLTGYGGGLDRKRWLLQHEGSTLF
jgi:methylated-DNA-[protein]-cysteine S-methyltransferase